jgi:SAM-dependent methyltransferase
MSSKRARNQPWELDAGVLRKGMILRAERSTELQAQLAFAAVPALLDHYVQKCDALFEVAARPLQPGQRGEFRALLAQALETGFELSAHAKVVVQFTCDPAPRTSASYQIGVQTKDIADVYETWLQASAPPYFGAHPDAKLMSVARALEQGSNVLDIGAGTGRNSLPLAELGLRVDAVEVTPGFAASLRDAAVPAKLGVRVFEGDAFDSALGLPEATYALIVASEVVSSHVRDAADLREFFAFACDKLAPAGVLLCNVFLARSGYTPDLLARQLSPSFLSSLFSPGDLEQAVAGMPLELVSNESCAGYERENLSPDAWPPTGWFEAWAHGNNLFDIAGQPPCELRWLVFRRA